jgi:hypothetical protein
MDDRIFCATSLLKHEGKPESNGMKRRPERFHIQSRSAAHFGKQTPRRPGNQQEVTLQPERSRNSGRAEVDPLRVVLCGSFRKLLAQPVQMKSPFADVPAGDQIVAPVLDRQQEARSCFQA